MLQSVLRSKAILQVSPGRTKGMGETCFCEKTARRQRSHCCAMYSIYPKRFKHKPKNGRNHNKAENGFVPTKKPEKIPNKAFVTDHILLMRNKV